MVLSALLVVSFAAVALVSGTGFGADLGACERAAVGASGEHVVYVKRAHTLCFMAGSEVRWSARASHGRVEGKKEFEGDGRTPEGRYTLAPARPSERFGRFLAVSYPNAEDVRHARDLGKAPGGAIGVHGPQPFYAFLGVLQAVVDHSDGCIVLDRAAVDAFARHIRTPVPMTITP